MLSCIGRITVTVTLSPPLRWDRALAVVLLLLAVALVMWHRVYRTVEMLLAGGLIRLFTSDGVYVAAERQSVYFGLGGATPFGLRMSPECTSAFLLLPLLGVGTVMILLRPRIARQVLRALGISLAVLIVVNQLRLLMLVGLVNWLGTDRGYYLGHTMFGSFISVFGSAAALVLFVWLATRSPKKVSA
jgi:exosortase/archaeosortase family protein